MMRIFLLLSALAAVLLLPNAAQARSHPGTLDNSPWLQPTWLKLLHYEQDRTSASGYRSAIHDAAFFLSATGFTDPQAEFEATLSALAPNSGAEDDNHAQCRFPARFIWIQSLPGLGDIGAVECPAFSAWNRSNRIDSISLVYATGFLGNPASFYGHTLLKFNAASESGQSQLLDNSLNYGAVVPPNENPLRYMYKGVFGGYIGGFSEIEYYFHSGVYGEVELRDLWEYELNLSSQQVAFVVAHGWELLRREYTYYFFRKNCAYRVAELLEIVEGLEIIPESHVATVPQAVMQKLARGSLDGKPLIREVRYQPSRQTRLYNRFYALGATERSAVRALAEQPARLSQTLDEFPDLKARQRLLDTLLDYYQYVREPEKKAADPNNGHYQRVLQARFNLPPGATQVAQNRRGAPHLGRDPSLVRVAALHNSVRGNGVLLSLRPAYYDVLDSGNGHIRNSVLSMGEVSLVHFNGQTELRQVNLVNLESLNDAVTGLPGDRGHYWKLRVGARAQSLACSDCLVVQAEGAIGKARRINRHLLLGASLGGWLQESHQDSGNMALTAAIFANMSLGEAYSGRLQLQQREGLDGARAGRSGVALELRKRLDTNLDIRLGYHRDRAEEAMLSLGYYF
ncbi:Lnb N-terminal periplasmic domain-containing protein [Marinobacterium rhizophilum]|uniref:DUF4105 domain-containing protein n=1 Tax=Marinobacterium rhizophilum TaxID=420402 RepID=A0ABY5HE68_9GAMM|nr:DUF4105 domain-containing protein [Marinobacterium rhizophilum]UTW10650.1 DUF4105 domain-containing protein [Marinobacterium rhizophilum]